MTGPGEPRGNQLNLVGRLMRMAGRYNYIMLNDCRSAHRARVAAAAAAPDSSPGADTPATAAVNNGGGGDDHDGGAGDVAVPAPTPAASAAAAPPNAVKASANIRKLLRRLQGKFMSEDGRKIDYVGVQGSDMYPEFLRGVDALVNIDPAPLSADERKSFFINVYHVLTIHALTLYGKRIAGFYTRMAYTIGGHVYSLDDIEHGVLRDNQNHPSTNRRCFPAGDPRQACAVPLDPRIHTALNCGATSCPGIHVYSEQVDSVLKVSAQTFLDSAVNVDVGALTVTLPKIFKWFAKDFGETTAAVLDWIEAHLEGELRDDLVTVRKSPNARISYGKYNWSLNSMGATVNKLRGRSRSPAAPPTMEGQ